jgi:hypothetical protein
MVADPRRTSTGETYRYSGANDDQEDPLYGADVTRRVSQHSKTERLDSMSNCMDEQIRVSGRRLESLSLHSFFALLL